MSLYQRVFLRGLMIIILSGFSACTPSQNAKSDKNLKVVATTTIVGNVVYEIGKDHIELSTLLPYGTDTHSFEPTPQDLAKVSQADVVFANGAGLETFLETLINNAGASSKLVGISNGIELIQLGQETGQGQENKSLEKSVTVDPHVWTDPNNVKIWVENIANTLMRLDPANLASYQNNAEEYRKQLIDLDTWIKHQVSIIPTDNRKLVTDHLVFSYFARRYGFHQVGALIPGYSTLSEPSAQELAKLEASIQTLGVKAIFVGNTVNPTLSDRVASDMGVKLVMLYTEALSPPGSDADSYLKYIRYDVLAITEALK